MKAVILAGGKGTRLAPYTTAFPKPLVPVGDMPILEIIIRQLAAAGFTEVTLTLGYLGELIRAYLATHKSLGNLLDLRFVDEEKPTGTAGSLRNVEGLDETFMVMNGDVLTTLDYRALVQAHRASGAVLTVSAHRKHVKVDLGVLKLADGSDRIIDYIEKPEYDYPVSMGVYVYEPEALAYIPQNQYFDFPSLVLELIRHGKPVHSYMSEARWLDIGRHEDYVLAQELFEQHQGEFGFANPA
jgi:NDP-sugar pyrophosphorylase family protein